MKQRHGDVLREIVDVYTQTGQPVGSKTVAERLPSQLSSATIRGVMADLESMGMLASPHTSAGRIPTEEGLRYYVNGLVQVKELDRVLRQQVQTGLRHGVQLQTVLNDASRLLAQMTSCAGLVWAPQRSTEDVLQQVEFVRLSGGRVLVILVAQSGQVENRIISVPGSITDADLRQAAEHLNGLVRGMTLPEAQRHIVDTLRQHKLAFDRLMEQFLAGAGLGESAGALMVGGSQNLFSYPELVRERLQELFQVFEEKKLLIGLLDEVRRGDGVQIFIGADCPLELAHDCSMITATYGSKDRQVVGTVGVIGPLRMNYRQNIALVDYTARLLSQVLDEF